ncbi:MAG: TPM domain-containing protein [bacterium]|nr:TPM domain-containing protein [bacterium]MDD5354155.1 TPM domain-containing protein [bacterium]MDD5755828.1 TPM domain-containing protein [bacterium]
MRTFKPNKFLTREEKEKIVAAIKEAEKQTSGEIRVHLEKKTPAPVLERAKELFFKLSLDKTRHKNGILIYLATREKLFAIIGDEGINQAVPAGFWDEIRDIIQKHFKDDNFSDGLVEAIQKVGEKLKAYFPYQTDDRNECPDEVNEGEIGK